MEHTPHLYDTLFRLFGQLRHVCAKRKFTFLPGALTSSVGLNKHKAPLGVSDAGFNHRIDVNVIWTAYIRHALANWQGTLHLVLDTTSLWGRFCWIRVSLVYRGRAIPIAWRIIAHKSTNVAFSLYK